MATSRRADHSACLLDYARRNGNAECLARRGSGVWFNRPDSKSGEPLRLRGFKSLPLRHSVLIPWILRGVRRNSARIGPNLHISRHQRQANWSHAVRVSPFSLCFCFPWCREEPRPRSHGERIWKNPRSFPRSRRVPLHWPAPRCPSGEKERRLM
jgi:hypothetical protein